MVKEATKKWHSAVETYSKKLPEELNVKKVNEQFEETLKYITQNATELSKKAQGNTEVEKDIKDFTKKQIDSLLEQVKSVQVWHIKYTHFFFNFFLSSATIWRGCDTRGNKK